MSLFTIKGSAMSDAGFGLACVISLNEVTQNSGLLSVLQV